MIDQRFLLSIPYPRYFLLDKFWGSIIFVGRGGQSFTFPLLWEGVVSHSPAHPLPTATVVRVNYSFIRILTPALGLITKSKIINILFSYYIYATCCYKHPFKSGGLALRSLLETARPTLPLTLTIESPEQISLHANYPDKPPPPAPPPRLSSSWPGSGSALAL